MWDTNESDLFHFLHKIGYQRLIQKFEGACRGRDEDFKQSYLNFLFTGWKPELMEAIDPTTLVAELYHRGVLRQIDQVNLNNILMGGDRAGACRDLFSLLSRKHANWEVLIYDGLAATQPELISKINPAADHGNASNMRMVKRTGTFKITQ